MERDLLLYRLQALCSAPRLQLLSELRSRRAASLRVLARAIRRSEETTFYHLSRLISRGMVVRVRRGKEVRFRLSLSQESPVREILRML